MPDRVGSETGSQRADPGMYARSFADVYDAWYGNLDDPRQLVTAFQDRCRSATTIVELGGGTGRLAAPLQQAGFSVISLDVSAAMLAATPEPVHCVASDVSAISLRCNCADAAFIAYNTIFNIASRERQHRCLAEAARVLRPGGMLAIEAFIAPITTSDSTDAVFGLTIKAHPDQPQSTLAIVTGPDEYYPDVIVGSHVERHATTTICRPWRLVYQSPEQLDQIAIEAGLRLTERTSGWDQAKFDPDGDRHVSWYMAH